MTDRTLIGTPDPNPHGRVFVVFGTTTAASAFVRIEPRSTIAHLSPQEPR